MVIAAQKCKSKGLKDEDGRESCWCNLGGSVVDWIDPADEGKWCDKDKRLGVLRISK